MNAPPESAATRSRLPLYIALGAIVAIVLIALVVVFTRGAAEPLDPTTPEGVVQRYTLAVIDGDDAEARTWLHSTVTANCEEQESYLPERLRVSLVRTTERSDSRIVEVLISRPSGGLFGPEEYQYDDRFVLRRDGERWAITETPWELTVCMEVDR